MRNYFSPRINPLSILAGALVFVAQPCLPQEGTPGCAAQTPPNKDCHCT